MSIKSPIAILLVFLVFVSCSENVEPELIEPGISKSLAELRIDQLTKVNYKLRFEIPADKTSEIPAQLDLGFDFDVSLGKPLIIDFNTDLGSVESVTADGESMSFRHYQEHIIIDADELVDGYNILSIAFTAGETGLNRQDEFIYTLFVPDRASTVFPCFDQPDLKANYELTLVLPESWKAVSNAPLVSSTAQSDKIEYQFERSDLMSTYLFSFAAGEFETITDNSGKYPMTMYHREPDTAKVNRNAKDIFDIHQHSLEWLEKYTAIDYPFKKFDFVLIPGFQYGGMEHVGAIQYRASSLFLDESASTNRLLGRASLIAHETAHMWFGDLVTIRWFDDVWLKEVFANFMAAKIVNPLFPEINHDQRFLLAHYPRAYSVDRTKGTHPIKQPLENLKQAGSLYGAIIYQKAPIVMRKLEKIMGETSLRLGLREYLKSYANRAADWHDLISILDNQTAVDLKRWSKIWVETPGMPVIKSYFYEGVTDYFLRFEQQDPLDSGRTWPQSFSVNINFDDSYLNRPAQ
ncbi:MAG: M1 family aminopeptidase, partial [Bacteroidota bacterium]